MAELAGIEAVLFLQSVDLFRFCTAEQIFRIATIAHERPCQAGESIYRLNEHPGVLYSVVRGQVVLEDAEGDTQTVNPLETFGVVEILSGRLRTSSATAVTDALLLAMDAEDFFDLLANNIEIVKALFRRVLQSTQERQGQGDG